MYFYHNKLSRRTQNINLNTDHFETSLGIKTTFNAIWRTPLIVMSYEKLAVSQKKKNDNYFLKCRRLVLRNLCNRTFSYIRYLVVLKPHFTHFNKKFVKIFLLECHLWQIWITTTAQKMKFSIMDFFSKCDQFSSKLGIWWHLLKKSLMGNLFLFCIILWSKTYLGPCQTSLMKHFAKIVNKKKS